MKKIVLLLSLVAMSLMLLGCGANWDVKRKEGVFIEQYLKREIIVVNDFTGETEYQYYGNGYVSMRSDGACINVTIMDKDTKQKVDILGSGVHIISKTIED